MDSRQIWFLYREKLHVKSLGYKNIEHYDVPRELNSSCKNVYHIPLFSHTVHAMSCFLMIHPHLLD